MPASFPPIQALASVAHRWVNAISGAGVATATQPAASDISGLSASATTDTTNASNISSGTLSNSRLSAVPNSALANSSITIAGHSVALGGSQTLAASDLSDTVAPTAWTPTDQSGASLSLTNNGSIYYRIGKLVAATLDITYPGSPGSAAQALISLPVATSSNGNLTNFSFNGVIQNSGAAPLYWGSAASSATVAIWTDLNLGAATNNSLASLRLRFTVIFFTT